MYDPILGFILGHLKMNNYCSKNRQIFKGLSKGFM